MRKKTFRSIIARAEKTISTDRISIIFDDDDDDYYYLTAYYYISNDNLDIEVGVDSDLIEVTDWMKEIVYTYIKGIVNDRNEDIKSAFTRDDYEHFIHLIYN